MSIVDPSPNLDPGPDVDPTDSPLPSWAPSVDEVAAVTPAYTRGGFDDDRISAGSEHGTYDATTEPTYDEVRTLIALAVGEIIGRVGVAIPVLQYGLAKTTALYSVKATISGGKQSAGTDDASSEYRAAIARYLADLEQLTTNSRMPTGGRLH